MWIYVVTDNGRKPTMAFANKDDLITHVAGFGGVIAPTINLVPHDKGDEFQSIYANGTHIGYYFMTYLSIEDDPAFGTLNERRSLALAFTQHTADSLRSEAESADNSRREAENALRGCKGADDLKYHKNRIAYCSAKAALARAMTAYLFVDQP